MNLKIVGKILGRLTSGNVTLFTNAKEAIMRKNLLLVDIMFIDLFMPTMNGDEVARIVRASHPHIKLHLLSGSADEFDRVREYFDTCNLKPILPQRLSMLIRA